MSHKSTTTAPIAATETNLLSPEFARIAGIERMFGIKRGTQYNLIRDGKIKGVLLRARGSKSGLRLIDVQSVRDYIASHAEN